MRIHPVGHSPAAATRPPQLARIERAQQAQAAAQAGDEVRVERTRRILESDTRHATTAPGARLDVLA